MKDKRMKSKFYKAVFVCMIALGLLGGSAMSGPIESPNVITFFDESYFVEKVVPGSAFHTLHMTKIKDLLHSEKSDFQEIEVFDTHDYGVMLVLDGIIQTSEGDEYIYSENISHLPMFYHENPKNILIIGGGDGGTLREIVKHPIDQATMVEIDGKEVEINKEYLSAISNGAFDHEKAHLIIGDGKNYIEKNKNSFDVIILDLSDPEGPAEQLITEAFYMEVKAALKKGGMVSIQSESLTEQPELAAIINKRLKNVFSSVKVHQMMIPTYEGGIFSLTVASDVNLDEVPFSQVQERYDALDLDLKYYTPEIHFASAILPRYLEKIFE